jgi:flagellin FlaB
MKMFSDRRGMTGLETAIILVAFVITAAAFAFVVLNMGFLTAQKSQTVISTGMQEASSSMLTDGDLIANCSTTDHYVNRVTFYVKLAEGKEPIDMGPTKLVVTYTNPRGTAVIYNNATQGCVTFQRVQANANDLLEMGERWQVTVDFGQVDALAAFGTSTGQPRQYESFRLDFKPASGSALTLERNVPAIHDIIQVLM